MRSHFCLLFGTLCHLHSLWDIFFIDSSASEFRSNIIAHQQPSNFVRICIRDSSSGRRLTTHANPWHRACPCRPAGVVGRPMRSQFCLLFGSLGHMNCLWDISLMGSSVSAFCYNTIAHQPFNFVAVVCIRDQVHELSLQPQANPMYRSCPCRPAGVVGRTLRSQFCLLIGSLCHMDCLWDSASAFCYNTIAHQPSNFVAVVCIRDHVHDLSLQPQANPMYRSCPCRPAGVLGRTLRSQFCLLIGSLCHTDCLWDISFIESGASAFCYNTVAHQPSNFVAIVCIRDQVHELSLQPQANPMFRSCPCRPAGVVGRTLRSQFCLLIGSLCHMDCLWDSASAFCYNTIAHQPSNFVAVVCIRDHVHELSLQPQANPMYRSCPCRPAGVVGRTLRSQFCLSIGSLGHMNCLWDISPMGSSASAFRYNTIAHQPSIFVAVVCIRDHVHELSLQPQANPMYRSCPCRPAGVVPGESPKLSQAALCCLISVCHAEDVTQPLEWSCHVV